MSSEIDNYYATLVFPICKKLINNLVLQAIREIASLDVKEKEKD